MVRKVGERLPPLGRPLEHWLPLGPRVGPPKEWPLLRIQPRRLTAAELPVVLERPWSAPIPKKPMDLQRPR